MDGDFTANATNFGANLSANFTAAAQNLGATAASANLPAAQTPATAAHADIAALKTNLIYAHLLGCNIGSKLTPIGSLCTLLWLWMVGRALEKNATPLTAKKYVKLAAIFTLPSLFISLAALVF